MKFLILTPPIACIICLCLIAALTGCDSLDLRNPFLPDQVPPEVRAEPRLVGTPDSMPVTNTYPRLADVPFKPKDFSPPPVYTHYMDQLEYERAEGDVEKAHVEAESPASPEDTAQDTAAGGKTSSPAASSSHTISLQPPQLPQRPVTQPFQPPTE